MKNKICKVNEALVDKKFGEFVRLYYKEAVVKESIFDDLALIDVSY